MGTITQARDMSINNNEDDCFLDCMEAILKEPIPGSCIQDFTNAGSFEDRCFPYWKLVHILSQNEEKDALQKLYTLHEMVSANQREDATSSADEIVMDLIHNFVNESRFLLRHHEELSHILGSVTVKFAETFFNTVLELKDDLSSSSVRLIEERQHVDMEDYAIHFALEDYATPEYEKNKFLAARKRYKEKKENFSMLYKEAAKSATSSENKLTKKITSTTTNMPAVARKSFSDGEYAACRIGVTVSSVDEKRLSKRLRKIEKKTKTKSGPTDAEAAMAYNQYKEAAMKPILYKTLVRNRLVYPNVFDAAADAPVTVGDSNIMLPEGTSYKEEQYYSVYTIPPPEKKDLSDFDANVTVKSLDKIGQVVFSNIEKFNNIQSTVFPVAYTTHENMLVCAPTGAGKTNIALMAITHIIKTYTKNGVLDRDAFKIVYAAPMKSLAAEITTKFTEALAPLGVNVREVTGDVPLSAVEAAETQLLVTTPEKWDVISRKSNLDNSVTGILKLLIIDEVHLLNGDRGPVLEALVARTLRQVESTQQMIRIIGLSATLPNYEDIAAFLKVNPQKGLFYFDQRFRPVPLTQKFIGVRQNRSISYGYVVDNLLYDLTMDFLKDNHQVLIFVHSRGATTTTANYLKRKCILSKDTEYLEIRNSVPGIVVNRDSAKIQCPELYNIFINGFGIHHAGLSRSDRDFVEKYFRLGYIRVLVTTATLAWGVNLPAHAVIIKGTNVYDSQKNSFVDLSILDALQIFGRAGRPQYDTSGEAVIITDFWKLQHYLRLITQQIPIESNFLSKLQDHLNAEISLGTVSNVREAVEWLKYTYLYHRIHKNIHEYGIKLEEKRSDPSLYTFLKKWIWKSASALDERTMIRFNRETEDFASTDLGRTASHYYINVNTVEIFNKEMKPFMTPDEVFRLICLSDEFGEFKIRNEERDELEGLNIRNTKIKITGLNDSPRKVNILLQTYISRVTCQCFSLCADMNYIAQNATRITRALFEITRRRGNALLAATCLRFAKMIELQQWDSQTPFSQFSELGSYIGKIENLNFKIEEVREEDLSTLRSLFNNKNLGKLVKKCAWEFPLVEIFSAVTPVTRKVLRVSLEILPSFQWNDKVHGKSENYWLWVEDPDSNVIHHSEFFSIRRHHVRDNMPISLNFTIPMPEPAPSQYLVRVINDKWLNCDHIHPLSLRELVFPPAYSPHTDLLDLSPLPVKALKNPAYEKLYPFSYFNPIQTQVFDCMYNKNCNAFIGAPTGSGKTIIAELAMLQLFNKHPEQKVVYIAPLKSLVTERIRDWKKRFEDLLKKKVVELTGDVSPSGKVIKKANIIVTTPEKWDGLSRSWRNRNYVQDTGLIIIDEIHLLGEDRGPVLEVIIARIQYISRATNFKPRLIGLSTAVANARDIANWMNIDKVGLYNFRPSVRPVPLDIHISGFDGKHYCPRMMTMNKPAYQAIRQFAPRSPTLVFVSSRRQTRLTATDFIAYIVNESNPRQWLHMDADDMAQLMHTIKDINLKLTLPFGIGLHHAGLIDRDRRVVEELFVNHKIQVLVATATLAWGVNFPAHLVVIKGTEYFDAKESRYVDMPITDVLQMMGRAGRPQFDKTGVAVIMVQESKKTFYKKFLYEPFPVESNLINVLPDHINAEIASGTLATREDFINYMKSTYFFIRLLQNPVYYNVRSNEEQVVETYLFDLSEATFNSLTSAGCIQYNEAENCYETTAFGRISSYYYISYKTIEHLHLKMIRSTSIFELLKLLSGCAEYQEIPVRHNEGELNMSMGEKCFYQIFDDFNLPSTKTFILLQFHISRYPMPIPDYVTDLKSVLEQAIRLLQAMIEMAANCGWLACTLRIQMLMQMLVQACWADEYFLQLYDFTFEELNFIKIKWSDSPLSHIPMSTLAGLRLAYKTRKQHFMDLLRSANIDCCSSVIKFLDQIPKININKLEIYDSSNDESEDTIIELDIRKKMNATLHANSTCSIVVHFHRIGSKSLQVPTRYFPKSKDETWFLSLGFADTDQILAMQRCTLQGKSIVKLSFNSPQRPGYYRMTMYLISDSYIGLDQQYDIELKVID